MGNSSFKINNKSIGDGNPTYIIAEMSANHAGDFDRAIQLIHAAKDAGADCIKIQTYTADTMTIDSRKTYFNITSGLWKGKNLYELYQEAYTPWEWHEDLKKEAEKINIDFLSTPFDKTAVDFLENLNIGFYKIASFECNDIPLIKYIASKNKPILISTGMASLTEIDDAVNAIKSQNNIKYCILKCTSTYPALYGNMNLKTIIELKNIYNCPVGFSDHSLGYLSAVIATSIGANVIEKHFCLSREIISPDSAFSLEPAEFKEMTDGIRATEKALGKITFDLSEEEITSRKFRRSIFVIKNMKPGDIFSSENLNIIRPGHGLAPKHFDSIIGKKSLTKIEKGTPLTWDLIE